MLVRDNSTRWGSWKREIECAMVPYIKEAIHKYVDKYYEFEEDLLTSHDWKILSIIKDFLENLDDATLSSEGHNSTLETILPSMDFVLESFEKGRV